MPVTCDDIDLDLKIAEFKIKCFHLCFTGGNLLVKIFENPPLFFGRIVECNHHSLDFALSPL